MSVSTKYARCNTHRTSQHPDRSFQVLLGLVLVATLGLFGQCGPLHASVPYTHDNSTLEQIPMASDGKSTLDWATEYYKRDLNPLPVPLRKKAPAIPNWQGLIFRSKAKLRQYFGKESNIGLLNGEPSDNTFDVDLDDPIAVNLAPHFLPETGRIHGRASSRASHWWYRSEPLPKTMKFTDVNGKVILEIRSTGSQTVVPPSIHPSGEKIEWEKFGEPGALVRDDWQRIAHLAVCTLFALHWPDEGSRHDCALALGGFLLRLGVGEELAVKIVTLAAESAGDEELEDRRRCVEDTAQKIKEGEATTGASRLADLLKGDGEKVVKRLRKWLEPEIDNGKEAPKPADDASEEDEEVVLAKPRIDAGNRDLPDVTKQALDALTLANDPPFLFRHAGGVARLERDDEGAPILRPVTVDRMIHELARSADWYATTRKTMGPALPPPHVAKDILATPNPPFLVLVRIVACPIFARDGSLQTKPGYNPKTQTFLDLPTNFKLPELPEHPSPRDLQKACDLIREELLGDFPLVGAADLAHCFALLLQPFAREPIKGPTPLFLIEKAVPGTGGTLMASSLTYPSLGCVPSAMTEGRDEDEWRKRITAHLRNAPVVTFIDNLRATLDSAAFLRRSRAPFGRTESSESLR